MLAQVADAASHRLAGSGDASNRCALAVMTVAQATARVLGVDELAKRRGTATPPSRSGWNLAGRWPCRPTARPRGSWAPALTSGGGGDPPRGGRHNLSEAIRMAVTTHPAAYASLLRPRRPTAKASPAPGIRRLGVKGGRTARPWRVAPLVRHGVKQTVGGPPKLSHLAPELRECGSDSATYGPPARRPHVVAGRDSKPDPDDSSCRGEAPARDPAHQHRPRP